MTAASGCGQGHTSARRQPASHRCIAGSELGQRVTTGRRQAPTSPARPDHRFKPLSLRERGWGEGRVPRASSISGSGKRHPTAAVRTPLNQLSLPHGHETRRAGKRVAGEARVGKRAAGQAGDAARRAPPRSPLQAPPSGRGVGVRARSARQTPSRSGKRHLTAALRTPCNQSAPPYGHEACRAGKRVAGEARVRKRAAGQQATRPAARSEAPLQAPLPPGEGLG